MPQLKPEISESSRRRILDTLESVASHAEEGLRPSQAIAKAAEAHDVPPGHLGMLVRAYNTARSTQQRLGGKASVWDKAASFPLADEDEVREILYGEKPKTAVDLSDYSRPPAPLPPALTFRKVASVELPPKPVVYRDAPAPTKKDLLKAAQDARGREAYAELEAKRAISKIAVDLRRPGAPSFKDFAANALAKYGDDVKHLLDPIGGERKFAKSAASAFPPPAVGPAYDSLKVAMEAIQAWGILKADRLKKEAAVAALTPAPEEPAPEIHAILGVPKKASAPAPLKTCVHCKSAAVAGPLDRCRDCGRLECGTVVTEKEREGAKELVSRLKTAELKVIPKMLGAGKGVGSMVLPQFRYKLEAAVDAAKGNYQKKLEDNSPDSQLQSELDAVDRHAFLQSLFDEPGIAGRDPHRLISAYQSLEKMAPRAMRNQGIAGDFLRKHLEGGPHSYFDLEALSRIEKNLSGIDQQEGKR